MLRTAAPTGWFLTVIYVIMAKNTITRRLFPQKKRRNRADARSQIVEKNPALRFFDSLKIPGSLLPGILLHVQETAEEQIIGRHMTVHAPENLFVKIKLDGFTHQLLI